LSVRSCDIHLLSVGVHVTAEVVKNELGGTCYAIAYWVKNKEGFDLQFIGDRPFSESPADFMYLAQIGQEILDNEFDKEGKK
jgi:hypothetical protein